MTDVSTPATPAKSTAEDNYSGFVLWASFGFITAFSGLTLLFPVQVSRAMNAGKGWVLENFDWMFAITPVLLLVLCIGLVASPMGRIRLGGASVSPEFSRVSWIAMLFAAGVGLGFMFFGTAEPLGYFTNWAGTPFDVEAGSPEARRLAFSATFFHWGLTPWAIYAVMGLSLGYFAHNRGLPLTIRSIFMPLIGDRIHGWPGRVIDLFAIVSTVFGLATTIGIGAMQISSGLSFLFGLQATLTVQIGVIIVISALGCASVLRGMDQGVKLLSNINMALAIALFGFVVAIGPTGSLLGDMFRHGYEYLLDTPRLSGWINRTDTAFFHGWTIFYWAWWVSWAPFVGMFIARISKGRTVGEYLGVVVIVPVLVAIAWFTVFGEAAITQYETGAGGLANGIKSAPLTLFQMLAELPLTTVVSSIAMLLMIIFIVTSSDSGALVLESLSRSHEPKRSPKWRAIWACMLGITAAAVLYGGGRSALNSLQAGTIIAALPFTFILLAGSVSLVIAMWGDHKSGATVKPPKA